MHKEMRPKFQTSHAELIKEMCVHEREREREYALFAEILKLKCFAFDSPSPPCINIYIL